MEKNRTMDYNTRRIRLRLLRIHSTLRRRRRRRVETINEAVAATRKHRIEQGKMGTWPNREGHSNGFSVIFRSPILNAIFTEPEQRREEERESIKRFTDYRYYYILIITNR